MPLGWIDFSRTERSKIMNVLDLLNESGTLDELGIAPIRDGFSNLFFPGTSTIQTRAKYFFIVPYIFKDLEQNSEKNLARLRDLLRNKEIACAKSLIRTTNETGIIGKNAIYNNGWVQTPPSSIYWSGLRRYGIFKRGNISIDDCLRVSSLNKVKKENVVNLGNRNDKKDDKEYDDDYAGVSNKQQFWYVPTYKKDWFEKLDIKLSEEEGNVLKRQIIKCCPESMLAFLLKNDLREISEFNSFQELEPIIKSFPERMQKDYKMALSFSKFMYAIHTLYNVIAYDNADSDASSQFELLKSNLPVLADIDLQAIFDRLGLANEVTLKAFLFSMKEYMSTSDVNAMIRCIKKREIDLKGQGRAKTSHPGEFDERQRVSVLDYRFRNAKRIIMDIFISEVEDNVESEE